MRTLGIDCCACVVFLVSFWNPCYADDVGTAFTAQAVLNDGGVAVNNPVDIRATLFDAAVDGVVVAGPVQADAVSVVNGILTWELDFGGAIYNGEARFIELAVRNPSDPTNLAEFITLDQRIRITPTPEAIHAQRADVLFVPATLVQDDGGTATLTVENSAGVGSTALAVHGDADVTGNVSTGPLVVLGEANVSGDVNGADLNAASNLSAGVNLNVTGDGTIGGQLAAGGDMAVAGDAFLTGDAVVGIDLQVFGGSTLDGTLDVNGKATLASDFEVLGDTNLNGTLSTLGSVDAAGSVLIADPDEATVQISDRLIVGPSVFVAEANGTNVASTLFTVGPSGDDPKFAVAAETGDFLTFGSGEIFGDLDLGGALFDVNVSPGNPDQFLSSTGTAVAWRDLIVGDLDMKNKALINIGSGGTSFGGDGSLNLTGPLDLGSNPINSIGSGGSQFTAEGGLDLEADLRVNPDLLFPSMFRVTAANGDVSCAGSLSAGDPIFSTFFHSGDTGMTSLTGSLEILSDFFQSPTFTVNNADGSFFSTGDANVDGAYHDSNGSPGSNGQVLSSTATGTLWVNTDDSGGDGLFNNITVLVDSFLGSDSTSTTTVAGSLRVNNGPSFLGDLFAVDAQMTHVGTDLAVGIDPADPVMNVKPALGEVAVFGKLFAGKTGAETHEVLGVVDVRPNDATPATISMDGPAGDLHVQGAYHDSGDSPGAGGQLLSSTGTGTAWVDPPNGSDPTGDFVIGGNLSVAGSSALGTAAEHETTVVAQLRVVGPTSELTDITLDGNSGDIHVPFRYFDSSESAGASGQVLSSTGAGTQWIDCTCDGGGGSTCVSCDGDDAEVAGTFSASDFNAAIGGTSFFGHGLFGGTIDISPFTDQSALAAFAFTTGDAVDISNFNTAGRALDTVGDVHIGGDAAVDGIVTKGGGSFKIDHPLDPANRYLYHSFVESPDMMNIYNGHVVTDGEGYAVVLLPDWFEALNRDFRYQLTVIDEANIDEFVQAKIVRTVVENQFVIRTSAPYVDVSWQVTGVRHDAFAEANRIPVEQWKPASEQGKLLHPEAFGLGPEAGIQAEKYQQALARQEEIDNRRNDRGSASPSRSAGEGSVAGTEVE